MNESKERDHWSVEVPGSKKKTRLSDKAKTVLKTVLAGAAISAAYFGVIAILMSPAFDVVPPA